MTSKENGTLETLVVKITEVHTDVKWMKESLKAVIKKADEHEVTIQNTKGGVRIAKWLGGVGGLGGLYAILKGWLG